MAKLGKRTRAIREKLEEGKAYDLNEALGLVKDNASAKFVESIDVAINLGVDPRKSDQVVRSSTVLPNGTGKTVRVAVFTQGANADAAKEAGADVVGMEDLAEAMKGGDLNYDVVIASPDAMRVVGTLGQVLGVRFVTVQIKRASFIAQLVMPVLKLMLYAKTCKHWLMT